MASRKAARKAVEQLVLARTDQQRAELGVERLSPAPEDLPAAAVKAFHHYAKFAEDSDSAIDVYRTPSEAGPLVVIAVVPDGDDGRFEAFTAEGALVGAGQFLRQRVAWAKPAQVRKLRAAEFLPDLEAGLSWTDQPTGERHSACGRFQIRRVATGWELVQLSATFPTLEEAEAVAEEIAPFHED